jgi:hypothetical protein
VGVALLPVAGKATTSKYGFGMKYRSPSTSLAFLKSFVKGVTVTDAHPLENTNAMTAKKEKMQSDNQELFFCSLILA